MTTIDLRPQSRDLEGYAGDTITLSVTVTEPDLVEGGTWLAQVRESHDGTVAATFDVELGDPGKAVLTLDAATTAALDGGFTGVWDCQVTTAETVRTLIRGKLALSYDVSRTP